MFPRNVMLYGRVDALPQTQAVHAGPLTALFENGDLRYIRWGKHEIIRRIYAAVRDHNWSTILPQLSNLKIEQGADTFRMSYDVENRQDDIHFAWHGDITGGADGSIRFAMRGEALTSFRRNRIGFCVLHPSACAGAAARVEHVDGSIDETVFPILVAPQMIVEGIIKPLAPFEEMRVLSHEVIPGIWADLRMEGDIFELEDQRNWLDASYKTYCTPLRLPFPVELAKGTRIEQVLTLRLRGAAASGVSAAPDSAVRLSIPASAERIPALGLDSASHGDRLTPDAIERLEGLNLAHVRANIDLSDPSYDARLRQMHDEAKALNVPLEIALKLQAGREEEDMEGFARLLTSLGVQTARVIILHGGQLTTSAQWVRLARRRLGDVSIVSGTDANFCELNRERAAMPALAAAVDGLAYAANPQVHAFDSASLVETLETFAATVETARAISGDLPIVISPITLKMRFNPYATAAPKPTPPGELPTQVDVRQMSLFGAAWTLGCIAALVANHVDSATFYETTGWRGVIDTAAGEPLVEPRFYSMPGMTFPLYHVLADVGEFRGGAAQSLASSDGLRAAGLRLTNDGRVRLLVANLTPGDLSVSIPPIEGPARVRLLDETTFEAAARDAAAYRRAYGALPAGTTALALRAYGLACIDT